MLKRELPGVAGATLLIVAFGLVGFVGRPVQAVSPTTEQLLQLELVRKIERIDVTLDHIALELRQVKAVAMVKVAQTPRPKQKLKPVAAPRYRRRPIPSSGVWSQAAERDRSQWRRWATAEIKRLRANGRSE